MISNMFTATGRKLSQTKFFMGIKAVLTVCTIITRPALLKISNCSLKNPWRSFSEEKWLNHFRRWDYENQRSKENRATKKEKRGEKGIRDKPKADKDKEHHITFIYTVFLRRERVPVPI